VRKNEAMVMNDIREIVTKAVIGKANRMFEVTSMMPETVGLVKRVLGTGMINHQMKATRSGNLIEISGSYEVHVWYTYEDELEKTEIIRLQVDYGDVVGLKNPLRENLLESDEIIVEEVIAPYATDVRIEAGIIHVDVVFEVVAEVIGETKMRVAILGPAVGPIIPEISFDPDDDLAEIDAAITPNFLEATILPFD